MLFICGLYLKDTNLIHRELFTVLLCIFFPLLKDDQIDTQVLKTFGKYVNNFL